MDRDMPSFARMGSAAILGAAITWVTFLVFKDGKLPDLGGMSLFIPSTILALFGVAKIADAINPPPPPTTTTTTTSKK